MAVGNPHPPVVVKVYSGQTPDTSAQRFAAHAADMAAHGYEPASQAWQGANLTVIHRRRAVPPASRPALAEISRGGPAPWVVAGGGILLAVGAFLPWLDVSVAGLDVSVRGIERAAGAVVAILGVLTLLAGLLMASSRVAAILGLLTAAAGGAIGLLNLTDIQRDLMSVPGVELFAGVGLGLWLVLAGAAAAALACFVVTLQWLEARVRI